MCLSDVLKHFSKKHVKWDTTTTRLRVSDGITYFDAALSDEEISSGVAWWDNRYPPCTEYKNALNAVENICNERTETKPLNKTVTMLHSNLMAVIKVDHPTHKKPLRALRIKDQVFMFSHGSYKALELLSYGYVDVHYADDQEKCVAFTQGNKRLLIMPLKHQPLSLNIGIDRHIAVSHVSHA